MKIMLNVYLLHKIVLYVKDKETIRIILEHEGYREYMRNNDSIYDDIIYRYVFELGQSKEIEDWLSREGAKVLPMAFNVSKDLQVVKYYNKESKGMERVRIYARRNIKTIKSMYRIKEKLWQNFPYAIRPLYYQPFGFRSFMDEIRYYAIKYELTEIEDWLKEKRIIETFEDIKSLHEGFKERTERWYRNKGDLWYY